MRPFETASLVLLTAAILGLASGVLSPRLRRGLVGATVAVMALAALFEGTRWQLAVAYVVVAAGVALVLRRAEDRRAHGIVFRIFARALAALALVLAWLPPVLLPVPSFPSPEGPYPVGTVTFVIEDPAREDPATPGRHRRLVTQVWYPAGASAARLPLAPYMAEVTQIGPALAKALKLPWFFASHLALARSHSHVGAVFAPLGRAPLVVYSHGLGGVRALNTTTAEALASAGYVVVAADHTHDASAVAFPDGSIVLRSQRVPDGATEEEAARLKASWVQTRTEDVRLLLDALASGDAAVPEGLRGHVDFTEIGVFGHSLGGSTAIEVCRTDARARACADLDGVAYGDAQAASLAQPFLRTESELDPRDDAEVARARALAAFDARVRGPVCLLHVAGSRHADFTDLAAMSPLLPYLTPVVAREGSEETLRGTNQALVAFFDATLRGDRTAWARVQAPRPRFSSTCTHLPEP
jgi:predicted dienelactone hydrolase